VCTVIHLIEVTFKKMYFSFMQLKESLEWQFREWIDLLKLLSGIIYLIDRFPLSKSSDFTSLHVAIFRLQKTTNN
jgi:hypothetical protein